MACGAHRLTASRHLPASTQIFNHGRATFLIWQVRLDWLTPSLFGRCASTGSPLGSYSPSASPSCSSASMASSSRRSPASRSCTSCRSSPHDACRHSRHHRRARSLMNAVIHTGMQPLPVGLPHVERDAQSLCLRTALLLVRAAPAGRQMNATLRRMNHTFRRDGGALSGTRPPTRQTAPMGRGAVSRWRL